MSWFQLDPVSIAQRAGAEGGTANALSIWESISRGIVGFTVTSVAGFAPWALAGLRLHEAIGEAGLYAVCAIVFIGLSGLLLHRLIIGSGSLTRFYKLFGIAFGAYAVAWTVGWMWLGGRSGSLLGLLVGAGLMGWMLACAFDARSSAWKVIAVLFVGNALGYFGGEWLQGPLASMRTHPTVDRLLWGVCYGVGFGTGLGLAFYYCQSATRKILLGR
jgi:hypothetical protein